MRLATLLALMCLPACNGSDSGGAGNDSPATDDPGTDPGTNPSTNPGTDPATCDDTSLVAIRPTHEYITEQVGDDPAYYWIPDNPRAIVFMFHGSGGSIGWLTDVHHTRIQNLFLEAGIGFIVTESTNRQNRLWDTSASPSNPDIQRIDALRDHFIATTDMTESTPIVGWGFSLGAGMAQAVGRVGDEMGWPVVATVHHNNASGGSHGLPALFISAENDQDTNAQKSFDNHISEGLVGEMYLGLERNWSIEEMLVSPQYEVGLATGVFDELVDFGLIAEDGSRLAELNNIERILGNYEEDSVQPGPLRVTPLLRVAWATHRVTSEFACEERAFLVDVLDDL